MMTLQNQFAAEAAQIKAELFSFNTAAQLKPVAMTYAGRIKRLLRKAERDLSINTNALPDYNGSKLAWNVSKLKIHDEQLVFQAGNELRGLPVKATMIQVLDAVETASPRTQEVRFAAFD